MTLYKWSQTASSDSNADATVNWLDNQAPSTVKFSSRAMMAAIAKYRDDNAGTGISLSGTNAYTGTTAQGLTALTDKFPFAFLVPNTNTLACTLALDGLSAKPLRPQSGTDFAAGQLLANCLYEACYNAATSEYIVKGGIPGQGVLNAASGTALLFFQATAPTGWTKSVAANDRALRIVSGATGGGTGGGSAFSTIFAARTITQANLPNVNFTVTDPGHAHDVKYTKDPNNFSGGGAPAPVTSLGSTGTSTGSGAAVSATTGISVASGGSGTALDFAVAYADVIVCTKN